ncbi:MAG: methylated-DNA--[protein]-cysteine S-methyltransferase [Aristaeellaceae bacterium]
MNFCVMDSPVGHLLLVADEQGICGVNRTDRPLSAPSTPLLAACAEQLTAYFAGELRVFDLPLHVHGTAFQCKVWAALQEIPYGQTISYGELARRIGQPKAARAVGGANHRNPICIIIPCHRVIGAAGQLTGYGGGLDMKASLLRLEAPQGLAPASKGSRGDAPCGVQG